MLLNGEVLGWEEIKAVVQPRGSQRGSLSPLFLINPSFCDSTLHIQKCDFKVLRIHCSLV